ncbi:MAG TPA: hypothetical protein VJW73_19395 [Gemmatimonadaceae bacterium]|nr:hypothetical protein [Gemmatimonadaceae bacterium]
MLYLRFALLAVCVSIGLFAGMLVLIEVGRRFGVRQAKLRGTEARAGVGVVDGSVYGLLALLIGFMFSGAAGRFDQRRHLIANEVNVIGTAWQRVDLVPAGQQSVVRESFRRYVDLLIAWYGETSGAAGTLHEPPALTRAQNQLWSCAVTASTSPSTAATALFLSAMNDMFGAVEEERMARRIHPPSIVFAMLGIAALATALFAGYGIASGVTRNWIYMLGVAATIATATYVILELEYPRLGLIRLDAMDQTLVELRATMN